VLPGGKQLPYPSMRNAASKSRLRGGPALPGTHREEARVSVRFFGCFYRLRDAMRDLCSISQMDANHHSGDTTLLFLSW
jgi:hypothetical protein